MLNRDHEPFDVEVARDLDRGRVYLAGMGKHFWGYALFLALGMLGAHGAEGTSGHATPGDGVRKLSRDTIREPHVAALHYRLVPVERVTFAKKAAPVEAESEGFTMRLASDSLVVEMLAHHATEEGARAVVEPYLQAWEINHALAFGGEPDFLFEFVRGKIIDRDPPPPGTTKTIGASASLQTSVMLSATASVERGSLPAPPSSFVVDADVETLWTVAGVSRRP